MYLKKKKSSDILKALFIIANIVLFSQSVIAASLDCTNVTTLNCGQQINGHTQNGHSNVSQYCNVAGMGGPEIVYKFSTNQTFDITLRLSNVNPQGSALIFFLLNCDETSCLEYSPSLIQLTGVPPGEYFIVVDSETGRTSSYTLEMQCQALPLDCSNPINLNCGQSIQGDTRSGKDYVPQYSCTTLPMTGREYVHRLTVNEYSALDIVLNNVAAGIDLTVLLLQPCSAHNCLEWGDDSIHFEPALPGEYYIVVDGKNATDVGTYGLHVDCVAITPPPTPTSTPTVSLPTATPTPDTDVPQPPTGLVATVYTDYIALDWDDNTETDLDGYTVYRQSDVNTGFVPIVYLGKVSKYDDHFVQPSVNYLYYVTARDLSGNESNQSNSVSAKLDTTPPLPPQSLRAVIANQAINLSWQRNNEPDLSGYRIYRKTHTDTSFRKLSSLQQSTYYQDYNILPDIQFSYAVTGVDISGNESGFSNIVSEAYDVTGPQIYLAGYWDTRISSAFGGRLTFMAYVVEPPQNFPKLPVTVEIYVNGIASGVFLKDDGAGGDLVAGDDVYTLNALIGPGVPEGDYLLDLIASDAQKNKSNTWFHFTVEGKVNNYTPRRFSWLNEYQGTICRPLNEYPRLPASAPIVMMGGYWDTKVSSRNGGKLKILAYVSDPDGRNDIARVSLYYGGEDTGAQLFDDGANGDFGVHDGLYGFTFNLDSAGILPSGEYFFSIVAEDHSGVRSTEFPYLVVLP